MYRGRTFVALLISVVAVPVGLWAALVSVLSLMQQVLGRFLAAGNASWTQALNPAVWLGRQDAAGARSVLDSLLGGPGAPAGTVSRYVTSAIAALVAVGCCAIVVSVWEWASGPGVRQR